MNLTDTLALLDKLNAIGAKHFKSDDLEVNLGPTGPSLPPKDTVIDIAPITPRETPSSDNTQKVQELIDLLKMKDEQLVNTIFPAGA